MRLPQFSLRKMMGFVAIVAIAMVVLPLIWSYLNLDWVDDGYALWGAADMVVKYLEEHEGRWPRGWDDLKPYFDAGGGRVGGWSFEEYQDHVSIRWDVDPAELEIAAKANAGPTFNVIAARKWDAGTIGGHSPNEILYRYFRARPGG